MRKELDNFTTYYVINCLHNFFDSWFCCVLTLVYRMFQCLVSVWQAFFTASTIVSRIQSSALSKKFTKNLRLFLKHAQVFSFSMKLSMLVTTKHIHSLTTL